MEEVIVDATLPLLIQWAASGGVFGNIVLYTMLVVGGLYVGLTMARGLLTAIVKLTPTAKDDKIVSTVFAFLDKYAYGFGKLEEYFEDWRERKQKAELENKKG